MVHLTTTLCEVVPVSQQLFSLSLETCAGPHLLYLHRRPQGVSSNDLCSIALTFPFPATIPHLSPLYLLFVLYLSLALWCILGYSICISSGRCHSVFHSYLSRSEWLSPISLHQMDGAFQGPWRWCCSLGGTQLADMLEGCCRTIQCGESWKKVFSITLLKYIYMKRFPQWPNKHYWNCHACLFALLTSSSPHYLLCETCFSGIVTFIWGKNKEKL